MAGGAAQGGVALPPMAGALPRAAPEARRPRSLPSCRRRATARPIECVKEMLGGTRVLRRRRFLRVSSMWLWLTPGMEALHWCAEPSPNDAEVVVLNHVNRLKATDREVMIESLDGVRANFILPSVDAAYTWLLGLACLVPLGASVESRYRALQTRNQYDPLTDQWDGIPLIKCKRVRDYVLLGSIGRGSFGKVKIALSSVDRKFYAVKVLVKQALRKQLRVAAFEQKASGESSRAVALDDVVAGGGDGAVRQRGLSLLADASYGSVTDGGVGGGGSGSRSGKGSVSSKTDELNTDLIPEIVIMRSLHHPNIVTFKAVVNDESSDRVFIVVEYVSRGSIMSSTRLQGTPPLSETRCREVCRDVLAGLSYLHAQGVVHRDIKPDNLLHCADGTVKISDFGAAHVIRPPADQPISTPPVGMDAGADRSGGAGAPPAGTSADGRPGGPLGGSSSFRDPTHFAESTAHSSLSPLAATTPSGHRATPMREMIGTPAFTAPELCLFRRSGAWEAVAADPFAADMWSVGATLFYLVFGQAPFLASSVFDMYEAVCTQELQLPPSPAVSPGMEQLLRRLLDKNPSTRLTLPEALQSAWFVEDAAAPGPTPPLPILARVLGWGDDAR
eukprot:TRINITY_DN8100_c0_g1_i1.p1 TRINITY_DN8100_c0_g1~~TRINITY_DN8100_c0_g1_i1.p1  ORF type:complete len:618 (+),score=144.68 TRINITY_DN8100_c0_g1_i1:584-2437(+)